MESLTLRTGPEIERALDELTKDGLSRSQAVRKAILDAERAQRRARLREESAALRNDPDDVAAARDLAREMGEISAW